MARLIMWNLMTLDGFVEGENRDISWHLDGWGEELERQAARSLCHLCVTAAQAILKNLGWRF